jgi:hypothetical protein
MRDRVFDHLMALVLFEMVVDAQTATVTQVQQRWGGGGGGGGG